MRTGAAMVFGLVLAGVALGFLFATASVAGWLTEGAQCSPNADCNTASWALFAWSTLAACVAGAVAAIASAGALLHYALGTGDWWRWSVETGAFALFCAPVAFFCMLFAGAATGSFS